MALASTDLTPSNYVLIGNNVSTITFQCQSGNPVVINFTATNSNNSNRPGLVYTDFEGDEENCD